MLCYPAQVPQSSLPGPMATSTSGLAAEGGSGEMMRLEKSFHQLSLAAAPGRPAICNVLNCNLHICVCEMLFIVVHVKIFSFFFNIQLNSFKDTHMIYGIYYRTVHVICI